MSKLKEWALSGVVISLAMTGYALAQAPGAPETPSPPATVESDGAPGEADDATVAQTADEDRDDLLDGEDDADLENGDAPTP
ncbi:MAG: hypothetical protein H7Y08_09630, partial [Rhizobiaceae bacterium]|nr:hypothetical protein [Rhizobiaceae bacterium]